MHCDFQRKRVLIVEDNFLIADEIALVLEDANAVVVGPYGDLETADLQVLHAELAILDIDIRGRNSFALADRLLSLDIPYIFFTGYDCSLLPERFAKIDCITKPLPPTVAVHQLDLLARASEDPRIVDLLPMLRQRAREHLSDPLAADRLVERVLKLAIEDPGTLPTGSERLRWLLGLMDIALRTGRTLFLN
jgi:DNA-binding NarL/FixJ family response regulator